jgi:hypothetical protein
VAQKFGKPFERIRITVDDRIALIGGPIGIWTVYHLTSADGRMYVTSLHFHSAANAAENSVEPTIDSLTLEPNGHWSVNQIMLDQPEFQAMCSDGCNVLRTRSTDGRVALLLTQETTREDPAVIFFEGDSATIQWKSVSSMGSAAQWVSLLKSANFEKANPGLTKEQIGTWKPGKH